MVTVSTPLLAQPFVAFNPNMVFITKFTRRGSDSGIGRHDARASLGYVGAPTVLPDLMAIKQSLDGFIRESEDFIAPQVCGIFRSPRLLILMAPPFATSIRPVEGRYPLFHKMLAKTAKWKVGGEPLLSGEFNDAKSDIKALDYAAAGIAAVVANVRISIPGSEGTFLRAPHEFGTAVMQLIEDDDFRNKMIASHIDISARSANSRCELAKASATD